MKIIITGAYAIGTHLARLLSRNHEDITIIDKDPDRLAQIGSDYDLMTIEASPESIRALKEAGIAHTDLYIAVTPDQSLNMTSCMLAKALGAKKTVARIDNSEYIAEDSEELKKKEKYWIAYYNSYEKGYNSTLGGDGQCKYNYDDIVNYYLNNNFYYYENFCNHYNL